MPVRAAAGGLETSAHLASPRSPGQPGPPPAQSPRSYNASTSGVSSLSPAFNQTADGAFSIYVSAQEPAALGEPGANWARVPWPQAPISLNMRV